jgi:hypothetical protein
MTKVLGKLKQWEEDYIKKMFRLLIIEAFKNKCLKKKSRSQNLIA